MDFTIDILNRQDFLEVHRKFKNDFESAPTLAISVIDIKTLEIKFIAIDGSFLPKDEERRNLFVSFILEHELAEIDYFRRNPEFLKKTLEKRAKKKAQI